MVCVIRTILILGLVDIGIAAIFNGTVLDNQNNLLEDDPKPLETRRQALAGGRKKKRHRSTSSSSGEKRDDGSRKGSSSIEISGTSSSTDTDEKRTSKKKNDKPKSSKERKGWRKWHRKCHLCPEDMPLKWRDPRIKWICGGYQRARRSFKSLCMMHYRNCQDGTMFTKIGDGRCKNSTDTYQHGEHFFYDYSVSISGDTKSTSKSKSKSSKISSSSSSQSSSSESLDEDNVGIQ